MRKPAFCICKNKDADQVRGNRETDQRLCFRYIDSTIPLLSKSEISNLCPSSVTVQPDLCRTRSETRMFVFSRRGSFVYPYLTPIIRSFSCIPFGEDTEHHTQGIHSHLHSQDCGNIRKIDLSRDK